jgi:hypothetical protein
MRPERRTHLEIPANLHQDLSVPTTMAWARSTQAKALQTGEKEMHRPAPIRI